MVSPRRLPLTNPRTPMPAALGLIAGLGASMALVATYWDDSWHTDKGRDEFAIPPHLLLYGGVLATSLTVVAWGVMAWRRAGSARLRTMAGDPALVLAAMGGATTLASAPVDNAWHTLYGRDAVLWSPPHLLAISGTLGLSVGVLAGLRATSGPGAQAARMFASAGIIGALQVLVLEYDSDVPQFSTLWYLPVASFGLCMALAVIEDLAPGRWGPVQAGALYTVLRAAVAIALPAFGFSGAAVTPLLAPLLVNAWLYRLPLRFRLVVVGATTPLAWWPAMRVQGEVAALVSLAQLPAALALAVAAGALVGLVHGDWPAPSRFRTVVVKVPVAVSMCLGVLGALPSRASAHDPGQGQQQTVGRLTVTRESGDAAVAFELPVPCAQLRPVRTVARRAGRALAGDLIAEAGSGTACRVSGSVSGLSKGRWFVYVDLEDLAGNRLEAWLPSSGDSMTSEERPLYRPPADDPSASRTVAGAAMLFVIGGLLIACLRLSKRTASIHLPSAG